MAAVSAGPRDERPDADSLVFKTDRPWPNRRLRVGAIIGHATPTSVRLWFRTGAPGDYTAVLYDCGEAVGSADVRRSLRARLGRVPLSPADLASVLPASRALPFEVPDYRRDTTHVLDIDDLEPDTRYGYVLHSAADEGKVVLGHNRLRSFRTPPPLEDRRPFQIALLSCHMPYEVSGLFDKRTHVRDTDGWDFLAATLERHAESVDVVLAAGDQCYADGVGTLDIWKLLNRTMRRDGDRLLPTLTSMLSWYRDIYRGYWGFDGVRRVFDGFPTYMTWDDHEIVDGWGSHYLSRRWRGDGLATLLPERRQRKLRRGEGRELVGRMFRAAARVYGEYQHSHNPETEAGVWDYSFRRGGAAFYVLDGRGQRDIERRSHRTLGIEQFRRFESWADGLDADETPFAFVVSAVPVLHAKAALVDADLSLPMRALGIGDDLRDSWEHKLHAEERGRLMEVLFGLARRGIRPCVLSGDVHMSAAFSIEDDEGHRVWQLTSSAITYHVPPALGWALRLGAAGDGETEEGHRFRRHALYAAPSYALVRVDPGEGAAWFKLYGMQSVEPPDRGSPPDARPLSQSLAKIPLTW